MSKAGGNRHSAEKRCLPSAFRRTQLLPTDGVRRRLAHTHLICFPPHRAGAAGPAGQRQHRRTEGGHRPGKAAVSRPLPCGGAVLGEEGDGSHFQAPGGGGGHRTCDMCSRDSSRALAGGTISPTYSACSEAPTKTEKMPVFMPRSRENDHTAGSYSVPCFSHQHRRCLLLAGHRRPPGAHTWASAPL